jgi:glycosyltransferase involved in cell wall biosynthesis
MGKRIKLGLIFSYNLGWIGGTYYILNLINSIKELPDNRKPKIVILSDNINDFIVAKQSGYEYLSYFNPYLSEKTFIKKFARLIIDTILSNKIFDKIIVKIKIDVLFPANNSSCFDLIKNKIYWFPDFQYLYYPENFSDDELFKIKNIIHKISNSNKKLVLSSKSARNDFISIKDTNRCSVSVIPFSVFHPDLSGMDIGEVISEYSINNSFFILSNQFWKHKNHLIVLKAALLLKNEGIHFQIVFTGKFDSEKNIENYFQIVKFIKDNNLGDNIKILGLIDRNKQLLLMKHSTAVIQPSLFEGWSTVIEDAKALNKIVIASDISVHREQLNTNVIYFNPFNEYQLVDSIKKSFNFIYQDVKFNYKIQRLNFANKFIDLID